MTTTIAILHPGEMGTAVGKALRSAGHRLIWAGAGRSSATVARARAAGFEDVGTTTDIAAEADVILSICPPHAALEVARELSGFSGLYVDANAVSPETARTVGGLMTRFVDGGIIGPPPERPGSTRLYLSGPEAKAVSELFTATVLEPRIVSNEPGSASAVKMAYAAWTKGRQALLLAARELAAREQVEATLVAEWETSIPETLAALELATAAAQSKGWRWSGEMQEIADAFDSVGLPSGFHQAAAEIYAGYPRPPQQG